MGMASFYGPPMPEEAAVELLNALTAAGYKHIDTAEIYKSTFPNPDSDSTVYSETLIGKWLATGIDRSSITIATKCNPAALWDGKCDPETVAKMVDNSLARLGTSYIDLYYLHRLPAQGPEEFFESMKPLVASGKVRSVGISEASPNQLRSAHAIIPLAAAQYEWSIMTRELEEDIIPLCKELGITLVAYSPLCRNLLAGCATPDDKTFRSMQPRWQADNLAANQKLVQVIADLGASKGVSAATLSLAWLLQHASDMGVEVLPIPGTTKIPNALENISAKDVNLTADDMKALAALASQVAGARGNENYLSRGKEGQMQKEDAGHDPNEAPPPVQV